MTAAMGFGVLVDIDKCIGCRGCQVACKDWNGRSVVISPSPRSWAAPTDYTANDWKIVKFREGEAEKRVGTLSFRQPDLAAVPLNCLHCVDPPCARNCPARAIETTKEGAVVIVKDKCIGCGYCAASCPFDVPRRGDDGRFYKCTFCVDRLQNGQRPACVEVCPTGVFTFGRLEEIQKMARDEASKGRLVYGINVSGFIGGSTRWIFVASPRKSFAIKEEFPSDQKVAEMELREQFAKIASLALPIAAVGVAALGLATWRSARKSHKEQSEISKEE
ncbi:MAG: 4Fe-4S dicluster domain-containing protein [Pyrobaculum sp.]